MSSSTTDTPQSCCNATMTALAGYNTAQTTVFTGAVYGPGFLEVMQGEAAVQATAITTALLTLTKKVCKCDCCQGAAAAIAAANTSALQQVGIFATNQGAVYTAAYQTAPPANAVLVISPADANTGYINVAASLAAWQVANPTATAAQIAAQLALIKATRSLFQANVEDVILAQAAATTDEVLNYVTCASTPVCPADRECFKGKKCDSSSSTTEVCPKPKRCDKVVKPKHCEQKPVCKIGTCGRR